MNNKKIKNTLSAIEKTKKHIEQIVGMPYEEFEKLDIDEQSKLLKKSQKFWNTYEFMNNINKIDIYLFKVKTEFTENSNRVLKKVFKPHKKK